MATFTTPWAGSATRNPPSTDQRLSGYQCGKADRFLHNHQLWWLEGNILTAAAELGVTLDDSNTNGLRDILQNTSTSLYFTAASLATFDIPDGAGPHTLSDLQLQSGARMSSSTLVNGVFTVGPGDGGIYTAEILFSPDDAFSDYSFISCGIQPSLGLFKRQGDSPPGGGFAPWNSTSWTGELAAGATLTFEVNQNNAANVTRNAHPNSHITVRRLGV